MRKPLQRRPNGIWCVQLWIDGKRVVKSLETRDPVQASKRAAQAIRELEEASQKRTDKWEADTPVMEPAGVDQAGSPYGESFVTFADVAPVEEIKTLNWLDLILEAESVLRGRQESLIQRAGTGTLVSRSSRCHSPSRTHHQKSSGFGCSRCSERA